MHHHLIELIEKISPGLDNAAMTEVMLSLSSQFDAAGCSDPPGEGCRSPEIQDLLMSKLKICKDRFRHNFDFMDVFYSDYEKIDEQLFLPASSWDEINLHIWKPVGALWSSPAILTNEDSDVKSSWTIRAAQYGDAIPHDYKLSHKRNNVNSLCIEDLESAKKLIAKHGSFISLCRAEYENGTNVLDFTWNLIFESEMAALLEEYDKDSFPCGIGVESSIWLNLKS